MRVGLFQNLVNLFVDGRFSYDPGIPTSITTIHENLFRFLGRVLARVNSSLSYAIVKLISSRSDANYNSTAMVSVNPNLLHSVLLSRMPAMMLAQTTHCAHLQPCQIFMEQKATAPSSQSSMLFSLPTPNGAYRMSPPHSATLQFTLVTHNSTRRQTDGVTQQQGAGQAVNSTMLLCHLPAF